MLHPLLGPDDREEPLLLAIEKRPELELKSRIRKSFG